MLPPLKKKKKKGLSAGCCGFGFHILTRQSGCNLPLSWMKASLGGTRQGWIPSVASCSWGEVRLMILWTWWMAAIGDDRSWVTRYRCLGSQFPELIILHNAPLPPPPPPPEEPGTTAASVCRFLSCPGWLRRHGLAEVIRPSVTSDPL